MSSNLSHHQSELVSYDQLSQYSTPDPTRTWRPITHVELVDTLKEALSEFGHTIDREQFAVAREGKRLFATFDLANLIGDGAQGLSIGLRHGNDKSLSVQIVGGCKVFVCDNMVFSGDMTTLKHKHTPRWTLRDSIHVALDSFESKRTDFGNRIAALQGRELSDDQAKGLLVDAVIKGACPERIFKDVYANYFTPDQDRPDCLARTAWALHNSFTRALHRVRESSQFESSVKLGSMFGL